MLCPRTSRPNLCFSETYKKNGQFRSGTQQGVLENPKGS
jgi:hypothetical protein